MGKEGKTINGYLVLLIVLFVITIRMFISNRNTLDRYEEMLEFESDINWENWENGFRERILSKETTCDELHMILTKIDDLNYEGLAPADAYEVEDLIYTRIRIRDCSAY